MHNLLIFSTERYNLYTYVKNYAQSFTIGTYNNSIDYYDSVRIDVREWILFTFTFIRVFIQYCFSGDYVTIPENKS